MIENINNQELLDRLFRVAKNMVEQDNRMTSHPVVYVQEKKRVYGFDPDYMDNEQLAFLIDDEEVDDDIDDEFVRARDYYLENRYLPEDCGYDIFVTGYIDEWRNVQSFFTVKGAEDYIKLNGHNLKEPRVYIVSGYMNKEWQDIREFLQALYDNNNDDFIG